VEEMSAAATIDEKQYSRLLRETLPTVIKNEAQNETYIAQLEKLTFTEDPTVAERELAELLTVLIEQFESEHYQLKGATPVDVLLELMDANGLKQKDLIDVFGTASIVSDVIHRKRRMTINQIKKLSQRFNVSPQVFF
jgi:HTH-type transcriptional regulator / antitoxin HigA